MGNRPRDRINTFMNYNDDYDGSQEPNPDVDFLDQFISSDIYKTICNDADRGDQDSVELIDQVTIHLDSIMWHIAHGSDQDRVDYDLKRFRDFVADFID